MTKNTFSIPPNAGFLSSTAIIPWRRITQMKQVGFESWRIWKRFRCCNKQPWIHRRYWNLYIPMSSQFGSAEITSYYELVSMCVYYTVYCIYIYAYAYQLPDCFAQNTHWPVSPNETRRKRSLRLTKGIKQEGLTGCFNRVFSYIWLHKWSFKSSKKIISKHHLIIIIHWEYWLIMFPQESCVHAPPQCVGWPLPEAGVMESKSMRHGPPKNQTCPL